MPSPSASAKARTWISYRTASLYHSGSPAPAPAPRLTSSSRLIASPGPAGPPSDAAPPRPPPPPADVGPSALLEVIEILLRAPPPPHAEEVRRRLLRLELNEVARAAPQEARAGQQIVHLERPARFEAERRQVKLHPARLRVMRIEVDD